MSIFVRPASPPPRQPSPDIFLNPLPLRPRSRPSSTATHSNRSLNSVRSLEQISHQELDNFSHLRKSRSRGILKPSPPPTPVSLPVPSPPRSRSPSQNRRSLSCAVPYRSPPASPTLAAPPPVPPIPAFVLNSADKKSPTHPQYVHCISPAPSSTLAPSVTLSNRRKPHAGRGSQGATVGMTCARFFSMCNSNRSVAATCTA